MLSDDFYTLDIETAPIGKTEKPFALEPYRCNSYQARITSIAVWSRDHKTQIDFDNKNCIIDARALLKKLEGKEVYAHRATFDVSFLIATFGYDAIKSIKWRDTLLLSKWLINGQKAKGLSNSLRACVERWVEHPDKEEFLDVKKAEVTAGEDKEYWLKRGMMDVEMTYALVKKLLPYIRKQENYRGYIVTCATIAPISRGYVEGIPINTDTLKSYEASLTNRQNAILRELEIKGTVLTSTKQLGALLFDKWNLPVIKTTDKGGRSTDSETLQRLLKQAKGDIKDKLSLIIEYKTLNTYKSKYVKGFRNSLKYTQTNKIHGTPNILETVTGRMTYSTKFFKKYQTSIAMHQLPRKEKNVKRCMVAPKGYKVLYMDFGAQEGRVMAITAPEPTMIKSYNEGIDLHSDLTEEIFGTPYDVIVEANRNDNPKEIVEQRQAGKLTGLSSFYRIGADSLANKFFTTYGYDITRETAQSYLSSFKSKYPGVVRYWSDAIGEAKVKGYAEAFGGWRYRINKFDWMGESSAINHPIQGGGSMLTYAAISVISRKWEDVILVSQVHDSIAYFIPEDDCERVGKEIIDYMSNFDYGRVLGFKQTVPLIFDGGIGDNFADIRSL